jgi:valyl-tRNA synthetase
MRNIEDWCISRQIWWGHRIPAWYDRDGNVYVGRSEEEVREHHGLDPGLDLEQDPDVLDTWYSSALWPFSTLGWPDESERLETWYPTSVLVTGFDIIFFWVARMIMMGLKFMGDVPFHEVYIHGLVRDADGNKMSKSKGNILDPLDLIDGIELDALVAKRTTGLMQPELAPRIEADTRRQFPEGIPSYGTDALRFTFCSLATQGRDVRFDLGRIEGYRNFCNKLWNASRFVLQNTEGADCGVDDATPVSLGVAERWIVSRLQETEAAVIDAVQGYRFDLAAQAIYEFTWNEYCDWYVELAKTVLYDDAADEAARTGTRRTLVRVLEALLRLAHPIMPFITESIWQRVRERAGKSGDTIMRQPYPVPEAPRIDPASVEEMAWVREFVLGVRRIRSEMNVPPSRRIAVLLAGGDDTDERRAQGHLGYLARLAGLERVERLCGDPPRSAKALLGRLEILVPLEGVVDLGAERARIDKELARLSRELERSEKKLANDSFRERAPVEVVTKEQERVAGFRDAIARLEAQRTTLSG